MRSTGRALYIQHQADCPPGYLGERAAQRGFGIEVVAATDAFPDPVDDDLVVPLGSDDAAHDDSVPYLPAERELLRRAVAEGVPVFGVCFGAQLLARVLGGEVAPAPSGPEIGWLRVQTTDRSRRRAGADPACTNCSCSMVTCSGRSSSKR